MKKNYKLSNLATVGIVIVLMLTLLLTLFILKPNNEQMATDTIKRSNDEVYNVLILGRDNAAGLCDVIMLGSINTNSGDVCFVQIPRDTYFNYSESTYKKINGAYNSLRSGAAMTNAVSEALGIKIDYYLSIDLDAVSKIVDAIGGIDINIPMDMNYSDPEQNLSIKLNAGKQTLDGKGASEFLRYRSGYVMGDLGRIDAQKMFLNSFAKKVAEIGNPFSLYKVFKLICKEGETNIKEKDLISLGLKCLKASGGNVHYVTAPGEAIQSEQSGAWYYVLSRSSMQELLSSYFGGRDNFDGQGKFVDNDIKSFYDIYNKSCEIKLYTADDIENNKININ